MSHQLEIVDLLVIVKNHPHIKESTDDIAKKLSATFSSSIKRKKGEFLRVKNKQGGFKRGVYKLSKKQTQPTHNKEITQQAARQQQLAYAQQLRVAQVASQAAEQQEAVGVTQPQRHQILRLERGRRH